MGICPSHPDRTGTRTDQSKDPEKQQHSQKNYVHNYSLGPNEAGCEDTRRDTT